MNKFRKKAATVDATQWSGNSDHHQFVKPYGIRRFFPFWSETCRTCGVRLARHGWVKTLKGGYLVCPGDWIITGVKGEHYACKPDIFRETYEPVDN